MAVKKQVVYVASNGILDTTEQFKLVMDNLSLSYENTISCAVSQFPTNKGYVVVTSRDNTEFYLTFYEATPGISNTNVVLFDPKKTYHMEENLGGEFGKLITHYDISTKAEVLLLPVRVNTSLIRIYAINPNNYDVSIHSEHNFSMNADDSPQIVSYDSQLYLVFRQVNDLRVFIYNKIRNNWEHVTFEEQYSEKGIKLFVYKGWVYIFVKKGNSHKFLRTDFINLDESHAFYQQQKDFSLSATIHKGQVRLIYFSYDIPPIEYQEFIFDGEQAVSKTLRDMSFKNEEASSFELIDLATLGLGDRFIIPMIIIRDV